MSDLNYETSRGFILGLEPKFFALHTEDELLALGYSRVQLDGISEALKKYNLKIKVVAPEAVPAPTPAQTPAPAPAPAAPTAEPTEPKK